MREIHVVCRAFLRAFLWTGGDMGSKKAQWLGNNSVLIFEGSYSVEQNKVVVLKHCWALSLKQDRLWIKWVHVYYVKKNDSGP